MRASGPAAGPDINRLISGILIVGVSLSALVLAAGLLLFFVQGGGQTPVAQLFAQAPHGLKETVGSALRGAVAGDALSMLALGVIILLATPVFRVAASIALFLAERDWLYSLLTAVVLAILLYSILEIR